MAVRLNLGEEGGGMRLFVSRGGQMKAVWALREQITEALMHEGVVYKVSRVKLHVTSWDSTSA